MVDVRALDEKTKIERTIADLDIVIAMIVEAEKSEQP